MAIVGWGWVYKDGCLKIFEENFNYIKRDRSKFSQLYFFVIDKDVYMLQAWDIPNTIWDSCPMHKNTDIKKKYCVSVPHISN